MKRYIKAQARSRTEVIDNLENQTLNLMQHLAYLYIFGKVQDYNHWRREIWTYIHIMPKIRIGKKTRYLTNSEFLDATYNQYNSQRVFEYVLSAAPELKTEYEPNQEKLSNISEFETICSDYFNWLAEIICQSGQVLPLEVYRKLDELEL